MNYKNIKIKVLILYSTIILLILSTFSISIVYVFGDKIYNTVDDLEHILFISIPVIVFIFILIGWFIINNILKRVHSVISEVNKIDADDLHKRITLSDSNDEIEELIITFNTMLDRIDHSVSQIKQFSNDVSHELKTPLTVIRGEIELGLRKDRTSSEYKDILKSSLEETIQLKELIDSLLFLSNSSELDIKNKFESIQLDELIVDIISENTKLLKEKNIIIDFKEFESITCKGYSLLLRILFNNIIQNAIKYSNKNSKIEISLNKNVVSIKDYGIGIKEENLEYIFDRFYRVDKARGRDGYGLGLSIVKNIAKLHDFTIDVKSEYSKYTQISLNILNK